MVKNLSFLFIILLICGCSPSKKIIIISDSLDAIPVVTGSVVNASAFEKGGTLVFGSFKAGSGTEANEESDQLSQMLIKGIKDALPQDGTHFTIAPDAQRNSDCLLDGYIDDYGRDKHFKLRKEQVHMSVSGEIWLKETGEKIFLFQTSVVIDLKTQNPDTMAYQIGMAIAHFIGKGNNP